MSEPRVRVVEGGVEIDVPNDHPRGALVLESARHSFVRIALDGQTLVWARVLPALSGIAWARATRAPLGVIPPIRVAEARAVTNWPQWFAGALAKSDRCWLRSGRWALSDAGHEERGMPDARQLERALALPESFVEHWFTAARRVVPLRAASAPEAARVKSWRKHAREGTLPPILAGWVSALDVYVVLDGHDRLLAARLEKTKPEVVGLYAIHETPAPSWADTARATALAKYERVFANEPRLGELTRRQTSQHLVDAWNGSWWGYVGTTARYGGDLATRFRDELASRALPDDVRAALLR